MVPCHVVPLLMLRRISTLTSTLTVRLIWLLPKPIRLDVFEITTIDFLPLNLYIPTTEPIKVQHGSQHINK